ncbi:hypothetical protein [Parerythrobacter aestuarii]|uniref:hypothetical protein n=1 Tax=Parerythrobacter aestuarii TaxID=3020909 RepID=UPI0024DE0900|nr:hypothetical protein [Parerythrobacter aestuarii]
MIIQANAKAERLILTFGVIGTVFFAIWLLGMVVWKEAFDNSLLPGLAFFAFAGIPAVGIWHGRKVGKMEIRGFVGHRGEPDYWAIAAILFLMSVLMSGASLRMIYLGLMT